MNIVYICHVIQRIPMPITNLIKDKAPVQPSLWDTLNNTPVPTLTMENYKGIKKMNRHGLWNKEKKPRLYTIWEAMKHRCFAPTSKRFKDWGGRGITVCDEWASNFKNFHDWAHANGYADNLTIDRIDNDRNYCPGNCKWSTKKEQGNNRRTNVNITHNGVTRTQTEWSNLLGGEKHVVRIRLKRGWTVERAVTTPINFWK